MQSHSVLYTVQYTIQYTNMFGMLMIFHVSIQLSLEACSMARLVKFSIRFELDPNLRGDKIRTEPYKN